ncbi:hypothetical protein O9G_000760, partial [Rozella allomycis CSF55]
MKKILLLGFLSFIVAPPVANNVCSRPLNVLMLGYYGAGKSTIVNVLNGLCDLHPGDAAEIAATGLANNVVTTECELYSCTYGGRSLNVVDTPGFQTVEAANNAVRNLIADEVPELFRDGIDAFMLVLPLGRTPEQRIVDMIDFLNSLITEEGFNRGFVVFSHAEGILMNENQESERISEFQRTVLALAPNAERFLNSVQYMFYRHYYGLKGQIPLDYISVRREFLGRAYNNIFQLCEANNGNTFSTIEMRRAKERFDNQRREIEQYRTMRKELEELFSAIISRNENDISSDLLEIRNNIGDNAPATFEIPGGLTQDETLTEERNFHEQTRNLRNYVNEFIALQNELSIMSRNVTVLTDEYSIARQKYNTEKDSFISQTEEIKAVQCGPLYNPSEKNFGQALLMAMLPGSEFALRMLCHNIRQNIQRELDSVPKYYIDKYMTRAGFNNDNFDIPVLDNNKPSINDYLARIELLEEKTARISNRITEIRQLKEEMRNAVYLVEDYEHKEKIIEEGGILFAHPQMKQMIFKQKVVVMNETQRFQGDRRIF